MTNPLRTLGMPLVANLQAVLLEAVAQYDRAISGWKVASPEALPPTEWYERKGAEILDPVLRVWHSAAPEKRELLATVIIGASWSALLKRDVEAQYRDDAA